MNKKNIKTNALKNKKDSGFFRALIFSFVACTVVRVLLSLVVAAVMMTRKDSTALNELLALVVSCISLVSGGVVIGKMDKKSTLLSVLLLGCLVLAVSYLLSGIFDLSRNLTAVSKSISIALGLGLPAFSSLVSVRNSGPKTHRRRKL